MKTNAEILAETDNILAIGERSQTTRKLYLFYISKYLEWLERRDKSLNDTTYNEMIEFLLERSDGGSPRTKQIIKVILVFLYNRILDQEETVRLFKKKLPSVKIPRRIPVVWSSNQIQTFFSVIITPRYKMFFKTQYLCGLRISEVCNLTIDNVLNKRVIGKGNKEREIFMPESLQKELVDYYNQYGTDMVHLFHLNSAVVQRRFNFYARQAGLDGERVKPHLLRRSFATNMRDLGYDPLQISRWMGHENINITNTFYTGELQWKQKGELYVD